MVVRTGLRKVQKDLHEWIKTLVSNRWEMGNVTYSRSQVKIVKTTSQRQNLRQPNYHTLQIQVVSSPTLVKSMPKLQYNFGRYQSSVSCPQVSKLIHLGLHYGYKSQLFCFVGHLFHLFIYFLLLMQFTVTGGLEPMLVATGGEVTSLSQGQRETDIHSQSTRTEPIQTEGEHRQHTVRPRPDGGFQPRTFLLWDNNAPPCCPAIYSLILFLANLLLHFFICLNYDVITNTDLQYLDRCVKNVLFHHLRFSLFWFPCNSLINLTVWSS